MTRISKIFVVVMMGFAVHNSISQTVTYYRFTGQEPDINEIIYAIGKTSDGGYIAAGQTWNFWGANPFWPDMYVLKMDVLGNTQWTNRYDVTLIDRAEDIQQTIDGGYIILGTATGGKMALVKLSSQGNVSWTQLYGYSFGTLGFVNGTEIKQTPDGGYIIAGLTDSVGGGSDQDGYLLKLDATGTVQWSRIVDVPGNLANGIGAIAFTSDGGYILTGAAGNDISVAKLNSSGDTLWTKRYDSGGVEVGGYIRQTPDGGYIMTLEVGQTFQDFGLLKIDANGTVKWSKKYKTTFASPDNWFRLYGMDITSDTGIVLLGFTSEDAYNTPYIPFLMKTDSIGDTLWTRSYFNPSNISVLPWDMKETTDKGFIMGGTGGEVGGGSNSNAFVIKTDSVGFSTCTHGNPSINVTNYSFTQVSGGLILGTGDSSKIIGNAARIPIAPNDGIFCCAITATVNGPANTICKGDTATITATGGTSYLWNTGDTVATITVVPSETTIYSATVSNGACSLTKSDTVNIYAPKIFGSTAICKGTSTTLSAVGGTSYQWSTGATTSSITISPDSSTTYTLYSNNGSCYDTTNILVTVNKTTAAISGAINICQGDSTILTGSGGGSYLWSTGATTPSVTLKPTETKNYYLIVTKNGCSDTSFTTVNVYTVNITGIKTICYGISTTLNAVASSGGTYLWNTGDTTASITVAPLNDTVYSVVSSQGACSAGKTDSIDVIGQISVSDSSSATSCPSACNGSATAIASGGSSYTYQWGSTAGNQTTQTATGLCLGNYTVTVSDTFNIPLTAFWTENFGAGCTQGNLASSYTGANGIWVITSTGSNDAESNKWFVSSTSAGMGAGNCGNSCLNDTSLTNRTLHIGENYMDLGSGLDVLDNGAGYNKDLETNWRVESPPINCTGKSNIKLSFNYIENGSGVLDNATLWYYDGSAWSQIDSLAKTATNCSFLGKWTAYLISLPASANNNTNVKIGFNWTNDVDGAGSNPSVAIDDITISGAPAPTSSCISTIAKAISVVDSSGFVATISGDSSICPGANTTLTASGGGNYLWNDSSTTSSITVSPVTTTTYSVIVSNGVCSDTALFTVKTNDSTIASITGVTAICKGDSATLSASGGNVFLWNTGDTTSVIKVSPADTSTYWVKASNGNCSDSAFATVNVTPLPVAIITGDTSLCSGDSTTLTASGGSTLSWSNSATTSTITVSPSTTMGYFVVVSTGNCRDTEFVSVIVQATPVATSSQNASVCKGVSSNLNAGGGTSYLWYPATGLSNPNIANPTANPLFTTTYNVVVTANNCADTASTTLTILPLPPADAGKDTTVIVGSSVAITASGGVSYLWSNGSTDAKLQVSPSETTEYRITVTDANGCKASDTVVVKVDMNCGEVFVATAFSPNGDGVNDKLYVQNNCIKTMSFVIYDRWGEEVFETSDSKNGWDGTFRGIHMAPGVFVFHVKAQMTNGAEYEGKGNVSLFR